MIEYVALVASMIALIMWYAKYLRDKNLNHENRLGYVEQEVMINSSKVNELEGIVSDIKNIMANIKDAIYELAKAKERELENTTPVLENRSDGVNPLDS